MVVREVRVTGKFERQYKRLSQSVKLAARRKEGVFRNNPFDARLETHKLHGKDKNAWAFSVTKACRIKFSFFGNGKVLFLEIGTHDIYK